MKLQTLLAGAAMALAAGFALSANAQIVNGGFETGDFTGWNVVDGGGNTVVVSAGFDSENPHSGNFFAALGAVGCCGTVSQTVATVASQSYVLSYWLMTDGRTPNFFSADWNGVQIAGSALTNAGPDGRPDGYVNYLFNVVGTGADTLTFNERNDPAYLALDDISLTATSGAPEPATWAMMLTGFLGAGAVLRRRRMALAA